MTWKRSRARPLSLVGLALCAVGIAACGGDQGGPVTARVLEETAEEFPGDIGQGVLEIEADPDGGLAYTFDEAVAPPGNTNIVLVNPQAIGHDVALETAGGKPLTKTKVVKEGSAWLRLPLRLGTSYVFYCSVPGHREAGMEGTIEVES